MITGVKNIILDLGGVIIDIDYQKSIDAFHQLGTPHFEKQFSQIHQTPFFEEFEKGKIGEDEFYNFARKICGKPIADTMIENAWNAMLLQIPLRRLQILQQLQLHYNTILVSNTNIIHERAFNKMLKSICGFETFGVFFDKIYYSHRIGMRKPDKEIFEFLLKENEFQAAATLFIDDSIQHIESARSVGIQTIHLTGGMCIENDIFKTKNAH